jgi:Rps23 Pro-64 3,4-dihydroxylase Tpa1-like proline 4-hydroxylase
MSHNNKTFLTSVEVELFQQQNYVVVDNFLGKAWSSTLYKDCQQMQIHGNVSQHYFKFGNTLYEKPNIFELDLHDETKRGKSVELSFIFDTAGPNFVREAKQKLPFLNLSNEPSAIKMQYNKGNGGCFPYHYDNPGPPSKRQLTCIVYLNPDWKEGDGGELELLPFLSKKIKINPIMDRAVLFRSDMFLHRVLPSHAERFCFTIWIDGLKVNEDKDVLLTRDKLRFTSWEEAEHFFANSPLQRVIGRAVYNNEYETSLIECVGGTKGEQPMRLQHNNTVNSIYKSLKPLIDEFRKRKKNI